MKLPVLLLPPLRNINSSDARQLAALPVWNLTVSGMQASTLDAWRGRNVELWLDSADVLLLRRKLPKLPIKRLRQALPNAIEDIVAGDVANLHCTVGPDSTDGQRWIAAVPHPALDSLLKALNTLSINVERVGTPALALLDQPTGVAAWINPASSDELRWAMRIGNDLLGGDAALADALGVACPSVPQIALPDRLNWNLIDDLNIDLPRQRSDRFNRAQSWLQPLQAMLGWLFLPFLIYLLGLGIDTARLALEKRQLAAVPSAIYVSLNPGQPVMMDARLLLRHQLDQLNGQADPGSNPRQLLPLIDAAAQLRKQLPGQPVPAAGEFANGQLILRYAVAPTTQPAKLGHFEITWRSNGREAVISAQEGS